MLELPEGDSIYRLTSIDPGTTTMGIALFEIDLKERYATVGSAFTYNASYALENYPGLAECHGDRNARLFAQRDFLRGLFYQFQPHGVISEAPFMGRFPQAYAALVECVQIIRSAVIEYDPLMPLQTVDPPTAKNAVGVKARGSQKEEVAEAVCRLPGIHFMDGVSPYDFDEHTADAVAVGYYRIKQLLG